MKILVTGAEGFVGKNLCAALREIKAGHDRRADHIICENPSEIEIYEYDVLTPPEKLEEWCEKCSFVFNLAGVNRPKDSENFMRGNFGFAGLLLDTLKKKKNTCPVMLSSSVQASLTGRYAGSEYGKSKLAGEELFFEYGKKFGVQVLVYRFPNLFGKWSRPNYNSAIATFCHNTARGLPISVNDPSVSMDIAYIDDVVEELISALRGTPHRSGEFCSVPVHYETTLGHIAEMIFSFPKLRERLQVPMLADGLEKKLYSTYLSFLPEEEFTYPLDMKRDERGSFTELLRTPERGQISVNISKPGITKGEHWHHTKNEKIIVVSGHGLIRLRRIGDERITEFEVRGENMQVVEMIPGYTHSIVNLSDTQELITVIWANEEFDPERPDTFFERV